MDNNSRKIRIENILYEKFTPELLIVRDDSHKHKGHAQIDENSKETHFYIKMQLINKKAISKVDLHRQIYSVLNSEFTSGLHALELDIS